MLLEHSEETGHQYGRNAQNASHWGNIVLIKKGSDVLVSEEANGMLLSQWQMPRDALELCPPAKSHDGFNTCEQASLSLEKH